MDKSTNEPIRVLQIVTNMSYGGLENLLMNYYRNIDRTKIQFDFLTHVDIKQDFEDEIIQLGGKLYRLPRLNPFSLQYLKQLETFFETHKEYKIVHSHLDCMAGLPLKVADKKKVPVRIAHSHSSNQNHNLKYLVKLLYKKQIPRYATHLFSCGKKAGDWMFEGNEYVIVQNAIDANLFRYSNEKAEEMREKLGILDEYVIGHVGQFRTEKNHLFLIDIFQSVLNKDNNCKLLLVGKGKQEETIREKVKELGIEDKVLMVGARSDIPELMQAMDIFVLPSIHEGLPVTMVEAQASGLPCLISNQVPLDCKVTKAVKQVDLGSVNEWVEEIMNFRDFERKDTYSTIKDAKFDIKGNAKWLEEFYCSAYDKY